MTNPLLVVKNSRQWGGEVGGARIMESLDSGVLCLSCHERNMEGHLKKWGVQKRGSTEEKRKPQLWRPFVGLEVES